MYWKDEGYLLSKNNFDENSIIIEAFTLKHGKYTGLVYGGSSKKQKKFFQIGNKILINWRSKNENKVGYFNIELIKPVSPLFFDDKKRSICILSATSMPSPHNCEDPIKYPEYFHLLPDLFHCS